jgi:glycosyltransferase involved in cell wall biosynthesis
MRAVFLPRWPDNPYQELLASRLAGFGVEVDFVDRKAMFLGTLLRRRARVVHLHAPDHFVVYSRHEAAALGRLALLALQLLVLKGLGRRVVWTAHDLINHEQRYPALDRLVRRMTGRLAETIIVHCAEAKRQVTAQIGAGRAAKIVVIPHGPYFDSRSVDALDRGAARTALGLHQDETLFLFLGNLRRHKGVAQLLGAFRELNRPGARLVIRGQPFSPEVDGEIRTLATGGSNIDYVPGFVSDADVERYMRAADVVVCPFVSSLTSGSLALAMSFGRACIAPRLGCIPESLGSDGGILYDASSHRGLIEALRSAVDSKCRLDDMGRRNLIAIRNRSWSEIARQTAAAYRSHRARSGTRL